MRFLNYTTYLCEDSVNGAKAASKDWVKTDNFTNKYFLYWFSGFTDAEGNFLVTIDRKYIKLRFKINLHIDDIEVLYTIKSNLGFGRVVEESNRNSCLSKIL